MASIRATDCQGLVNDWRFSSGTQLAWIVHPDEEFVEVCHAPSDRKLVGPGGELEGEHLLPGFRYPIDELFAPEEWEQ
jgi:Uma2 family endonuclease